MGGGDSKGRVKENGKRWKEENRRGKEGREGGIEKQGQRTRRGESLEEVAHGEREEEKLRAIVRALIRGKGQR